MIRLLGVVVATALLSGCARSATGPAAVSSTPAEDPVAKDLKALEGKWAVVSMEREGEKAPAEQLGDMVLQFGNGTVHFHKGKSSEDPAAITLHPQHSPRRIDFVIDQVAATKRAGGVDTKKSKEQMYGIYSLDGDKLTLCMNDRTKEYPKAFATAKGSDSALVVLQRVKP